MGLCWMKCSGDIDGRVPVTSTKYSINKMKLPVKTAWHPWFVNKEVLHSSFYLKCFNTCFYFKKAKNILISLIQQWR